MQVRPRLGAALSLSGAAWPETAANSQRQWLRERRYPRLRGDCFPPLRAKGGKGKGKGKAGETKNKDAAGKGATATQAVREGLALWV